MNDLFKLEEAAEPIDCDNVYYQSPEEFRSELARSVVHDDADEAIQPDEVHYEYRPKEEEPAPIDPMDAIRREKSNVHNVTITKFGDKYYIDHNDLRCYMDSCGEMDYDSAVKNIIDAHHDEPGLTSDNLGVVVSRDTLSEIDPYTKSTMESSKVSFEVYG